MTIAYLLDTNIVSELRKPRPHGGVLAWLESLDDAQLYLSAVTLAEIQAGIELTCEQDPGKAQNIEAWLDLLASAYKVLPMAAATFRAWARLMHRKSDTLCEDAMIAATAKVHGLTVPGGLAVSQRVVGLAQRNSTIFDKQADKRVRTSWSQMLWLTGSAFAKSADSGQVGVWLRCANPDLRLSPLNHSLATASI